MSNQKEMDLETARANLEIAQEKHEENILLLGAIDTLNGIDSKWAEAIDPFADADYFDRARNFTGKHLDQARNRVLEMKSKTEKKIDQYQKIISRNDEDLIKRAEEDRQFNRWIIGLSSERPPKHVIDRIQKERKE